LYINYSYILKNFIGKNGITKNDLTKLKEKGIEAIRNLKKKKKELGFIQLPSKIREAKKILEFAQKNKSKYNNFILIGIGGSALGNKALFEALCHPFHNLLPKEKRNGTPRFFILDNVDPDVIEKFLETVSIKRSIINVISKSGTTTETIANFFIVLKKLVNKVGDPYYKGHLIITTDPKKGFLRDVVKKEKIVSFKIPENVGGRFSVLSPVGLVSSAFVGIDIIKLLKGASYMRKLCENEDIEKNPALLFALINYIFMKKRNILVMFSYSQKMSSFVDWFLQLWAESLGKNGFGTTPVKAIGTIDQHSQLQLYMDGPDDKLFCFVSVDKFESEIEIPPFGFDYLNNKKLLELLKAEEKATRTALKERGKPSITIHIPEITPYHIGEFIFMLEYATAIMGELLKINAFDQPGVERGKTLTKALMGEEKLKEERQKFLKEIKKYEESPYKV
ncbi:MAG: glucose-6-phosphate isomerase, partial [Caldiserica bacterium]